jgi:hypothetical protein
MRFLRDSAYGLSGWKEAKVARSAASLKVERVPVAEEFISSTPSMELEGRMSEDKSKAPHDFTWKAQANDNEVPVNPGDMLPNRSDPMASLWHSWALIQLLPFFRGAVPQHSEPYEKNARSLGARRDQRQLRRGRPSPRDSPHVLTPTDPES